MNESDTSKWRPAKQHVIKRRKKGERFPLPVNTFPLFHKYMLTHVVSLPCRVRNGVANALGLYSGEVIFADTNNYKELRIGRSGQTVVVHNKRRTRVLVMTNRSGNCSWIANRR